MKKAGTNRTADGCTKGRKDAKRDESKDEPPEARMDEQKDRDIDKRADEPIASGFLIKSYAGRLGWSCFLVCNYARDCWNALATSLQLACIAFFVSSYVRRIAYF